MQTGRILFLNSIWGFGRTLLNQRRSSSYIVTLLLVCILLTGCIPTESQDYLVACGSHSIPGMFCHELKGGSYECTILEKDVEGRILYEYTTYHSLRERNETAIIVCQRYDDQYVYYYEDQCYLLGSFHESDIESLKENNDWNEPLYHDKMSRRALNVSDDRFLITDTNVSFEDGRIACCNALRIYYDQVKDLYVSDIDGAGLSLFILEIERNGSAECYLALFDANGSVVLSKIEDQKLSVKDIATFKMENGWVYGF